MRLLVIVPFLNEEELLPTFLASMRRQSRPPERLLLVDDGSSDGSPEIVEAFVRDHQWAVGLRRPPRPPERDRLATAAELKAFQWGLEQCAGEQWDVIAKLDADLALRPTHFDTVMREFDRDPGLGTCGSFLAARGPDGVLRRERHPPDHVRGPNKFYRRQCLEQISPVPAILGWDGFDDVAARMHGWQTRSVGLEDGDSEHLRPTGSHGGGLRAQRRWGLCAWAYGAHPLVALTNGLLRGFRERPPVLAGAHFAFGYLRAMAVRAPRAAPAIVRHRRLEERRRIERALRR